MQWTGAWNVDRMLSEFRQPLGDTQNKGLLLYQYENTWRSSEDSYTAKFPRITATNRKNNFEKGSDLYLINASYLRLKNIEIGYNFDFPFMRKLKLNSCRMYVNGYNLLTFTAFDWGYAYYLSKNSEDKPSVDHPYTSYDPDPLNGSNPVYRYFTLTTSDWTAIKNKYFIAACTILNAGNTVDKDSKGNIYGCLIFPIVADADIRDVQILKDRNKNEKVIAMLNKVDGITTTNKVKTIENLSFTTTSGPTYFNADWIKMTVEQFKQLEAMGVVFLPQAGYRAEESLATKSGYYWTATAGQDRTSTIFRFDGNLSTKEFKLDSQIARSLGCSVRLVKEVPEDYKDPFAD